VRGEKFILEKFIFFCNENNQEQVEK